MIPHTPHTAKEYGLEGGSGHSSEERSEDGTEH